MKKNKFNLAMIPDAESVAVFVKYAREAFNIEPAEYQLGEYSHPHVTLCHFEANENEVDNVIESIRTLNVPSMPLAFATHRSKVYSDHPIWGQWAWVSLIPDKLAELKAWHLKIAKIVTPTNFSFEHYDPHLTLFNSREIGRCHQINDSPKVHPVLSGNFHLALGRLDDVGQIIEIIEY